MLRSLLRKSFTYFFSSFVVISITFCALHLIPGDPFTRELTLPKEMVKVLRKHYGLDQPIYIQYLSYLRKMMVLDLGPSLIYEGRTVMNLVKEALPVSFILGLISSVVSLVLGATLGVVFAKTMRQRQAMNTIGAMGLCVPTFVLAPFLQYFFALKLPLFPIGRLEQYSSFVLPLLTLSFVPIFQVAKIVHLAIHKILQEDYIKTARAKGMPERKIWRDHIAKNVLVPVLDYFVPLTSYLLMGSFVVEHTFSLSGMGQLMVRSIESRDYGCVMGLVVMYCFVLFFIECCVSILKAYLDPRTQHEIS